MVFRNHKFIGLATATAIATTLLSMSVVHATSFLEKPSIVTYWGQNSRGTSDSQKNLASYCDDHSDVLIMSFVLNFSDGSLPLLNLANGCEGSTFPGTELLNCTDVAADIKTCQDKGKTILISLGGANGVYGFSNDADAEAFADTLWDIFGAGHSDTRPFGDSIIDGFDLDIEGGGSTGYVAMIKRLRKHFTTDSSKDYYITGAPQCPYPDAMLGTVLDAVEFDAVNVQFYNNYCSTTSSSFNFETWDTWAKKTSPNSNVKVLLGVPGSNTAAGSGYVAYDALEPIVQELYSTYSSFGGVTLWDASASYENKDVLPNYQATVAELVHGLSDDSDNGNGGDDEATTSITKKSIRSTKTTSHYKSTSISVSNLAFTTATTDSNKSSRTRKSNKTKSTKLTSTMPEITKATSNRTKPSKTASNKTKTTNSKSTKSKFITSEITMSKSTKTRSTKSKSNQSKHTTTKAKSTKTLTSTTFESTNSPISCVTNASKCSIEGQVACSGNLFATCNNGKWVLRSCPSSLTCFSTTDGSSIYCGQGTNSGTCPNAKSNLLVEATSFSTTFKKPSFVGPTAKPYKSGRVVAQFSVIKSESGSFEAVINARRLDQKSFGDTVIVSFKVADSVKITSVSEGKVTQTGNQVKVQYRGGSGKTMVAIMGIEGEIASGGIFVAPNANSMKFSS